MNNIDIVKIKISQYSDNKTIFLLDNKKVTKDKFMAGLKNLDSNKLNYTYKMCENSLTMRQITLL